MKYRHILLLSIFPCLLQSQALQKFELFPRQPIAPLFTADATAHRIGVTSINLSRRVSVSLGNLLPVANVTVYGQPLGIAVGGSIHAELEPDEMASLVTTDFFVDYLLVDIPFTPDWILRMGVGHSSHHLSDNWYELLQKTSSLTYSKDYSQLFVVRKIPAYNLFLYGGVTYAYAFIVNTEISPPWLLQCGGEKDLASYFDDMLSLYCAIDIKLRQEASFGATQSYQLGLQFKNNNERNLRLAYQFRSGLDERGQFYNERRSFHGVSLYVEL